MSAWLRDCILGYILPLFDCSLSSSKWIAATSAMHSSPCATILPSGRACTTKQPHFWNMSQFLRSVHGVYNSSLSCTIRQSHIINITVLGLVIVISQYKYDIRDTGYRTNKRDITGFYPKMTS